MITEKEKKNRESLFNLMKEYPDIPVIPIVDTDVVYDDCCSSWLGSWGYSWKTKYVTSEERIYFEDDDEEDILSAVNGYDWYENATDEEVKEAIKNLDWIEAICVRISMPDI